MTPEEKQLIEQRQYGVTIAQVAQLVANHDGCATGIQRQHRKNCCAAPS